MNRLRSLTLFLGVLLLISVAIVAILLLQDPDAPLIPSLRPAPEITPSLSLDPRLLQSRLDQIVAVDPGTDIQAVVDEHPPGSIFLIRSGIYRLQQIVPRDGDIFIGEPGAVLNGARLLEGFEAENDYWLLRDQPEELWVAGQCLSDFPRCNYANDLFLDDKPLQQAGSLDDLEPNTWFFDYDSRTIYLAADPANRVIELSSRVAAFQSEARDVLIYGLTVEKYAGPGQVGAIRAIDGSNWRIEGSVVRLNSGGGITVGNGTQVINNRVIDNGQIGVSGIGDNIVVEGNEIAHNNFAGYDAGWEAGGTKFVESRDLLVRGNYVHHNHGPGLWTDGSNINVLYEHNLVVNNGGTGIFHEISYDAVIRDNVVMYNAATTRQMFAGGQIMISSSSNTEVHDNLAVVGATGGNAIIVVQQDRGGSEQGQHISTDNIVHNNTIVMLNGDSQTGAAGDLESGEDDWDVSTNQFRDNLYYILDLSNRNWGWPHSRRTWTEWQGLGLDAGGTVSTDIPLHLTLIPAWRR